MAEVAIVGAGSMQFTQQVVSDLMRAPATQDVAFSLMDVDEERLALSERLVHRIQGEVGGRGRVRASRELETALTGVDFCLNEIQVGGMTATQLDFDVPAAYGIRQTIGDTLGIGGISRALRTIPVVVDIARTLRRVAPDAWLLNYTNPMAMVMWAVAVEVPEVTAVGLCHSAEYTARALAGYLEVPFAELDWMSAGINHMAWLLKLGHRGEDLYPRLRELARDPAVFAQDPVRFELLRLFGRFVTESSEHNAEYVPYFLPHDDEVDRLHIPVGEYLRRSRNSLLKFDDLKGRVREPGSLMVPASPEYAPRIVAARITGDPLVFYGNVPNRGAIANLPPDALVEVPCLVEADAIWPTQIGTLPPGPAALNRQAIGVQELTVRAALRGDRDLLYQAAALDPLLATRLRLGEIVRLVDALLVAQRSWLPACWTNRDGGFDNPTP